jgi:hypothetical protein
VEEREKRLARVKVSYADSELTRLREEAKAEGRSVSELIRHRSLRPVPQAA